MKTKKCNPDTLGDRVWFDVGLPTPELCFRLTEEVADVSLHGSDRLDVKNHRNIFFAETFRGWPTKKVRGKVLKRLLRESSDWRSQF